MDSSHRPEQPHPAAGLPLPPNFDPSRADQVWRVPYQERAAEAEEWAVRHQLGPACAEPHRVCLLVIDAQNSFCLPGFELFVGGRSGRGAVEDNVRLCEFIYRNLGRITDIVCTLDTHSAFQIFHPVFLTGRDGHHPPPVTPIRLEDVEDGTWRTDPDVARALSARGFPLAEEHLRHYARALAQGGKYSLMTWPYHAMLGGIGHALASLVEEAVFFHAIARKQPTQFEIKGQHPLTEHYSVLGPEVCTTRQGREIAEKDVSLVRRLLECDALYVAGQAKSHCVCWTVHDLLEEIRRCDPALAGRLHVLEDCMSPVVAPGVVDFTDSADEAFEQFRQAGVRIVRSTDPLELPAIPGQEVARP